MDLKLFLSLCAIVVASLADARYVLDPLYMAPEAQDEYAMVMESVKRAELMRDQDDEPISVYYEGLGHFFRNGSWSVINRLPQSPAEVQTKFLLATSADQNYDTAEVLDYMNFNTIASSVFDPTAVTRVFLHGFGGNGRQANGWQMKNLMLVKEKVNFIVVDWSIGAATPDYWQACGNAQLIGAQLARIIQLLLEVKGASMSKIELIGYSLGAQAVAFTAHRLTEYGIQTPIKKLIALDPAGPFFENSDIIARLDAEDAEFVEVIHSNGANLFAGGLGMARQAGHIDFYPNGGAIQPGCSNMILGAIDNIIAGNFDELSPTVLCSHQRAPQLLMESIAPENCAFESFACDSYDNFRKGHCRTPDYHDLGSNMNFYHDSRKPSKHRQFFMTTAKTPFCSRHIFIKIDSSEDAKETVGIVEVTIADTNGQIEIVTVLDNERLKPGRSASSVLASGINVEDIVSVQVAYQTKCSWLTPNCSKTLKFDAVHIESMDRTIRKSTCNDAGATLADAEFTGNLPLTTTQC